MNRNLQGEELTKTELLEIAEANGLLTDTFRNQLRHMHNDNLAMSLLNQRTQQVRFEMWARRELILDTRP